MDELQGPGNGTSASPDLPFTFHVTPLTNSTGLEQRKAVVTSPEVQLTSLVFDQIYYIAEGFAVWVGIDVAYNLVSDSDLVVSDLQLTGFIYAPKREGIVVCYGRGNIPYHKTPYHTIPYHTIIWITYQSITWCNITRLEVMKTCWQSKPRTQLLLRWVSLEVAL